MVGRGWSVSQRCEGRGRLRAGHDEPELARLEHQARLLEPATVAILRLAGISPGMRVLDVGTGLGDVAFAAAELVGSAEAVMGIDQKAAFWNRRSVAPSRVVWTMSPFEWATPRHGKHPTASTLSSVDSAVVLP